MKMSILQRELVILINVHYEKHPHKVCKLAVKVCDHTYLFNFPMSEFLIIAAFCTSRQILIYMAYDNGNDNGISVQSKKIRNSKEKCNHCWKVSPPHHHNESSMRLAAWLKFQTKSRAIIIEIFYFLGCVCASVLSKIPSIFYSNIPCAASKQSGRMFWTFASQCFDRYRHYHFHRAHL